MNYISEIGSSNEQLNWGGKASSLNILSKRKINVPRAIVLSSELYDKYKTEKKICETDIVNIQKSIENIGASSYMVRSSAIGEDGIENSFAGQLDSFKSSSDIKDITSKIIQCWDSSESDRVKVYQEVNSVKLGGVAVVIQELIDPDYAGVLFTTSPLNESEMLVEYVKGHAETLVQGEVIPESISISKNKVENTNIPFNIKKLISVVSDILDIYENLPQDIEWVAKGDEIYIVQSRPITTIKDKIKWSNTNVNENYPEKLSPLLYSVARRSYYHYFKNLAQRLGVIDQLEVQYDDSFSNIIGLWGHKMFYNMSSIHNVLDLTPIKGIFKRSFDDFVGYQEDSEEHSKYKKFFSVILFSIKLLYNFIKLPKRVIYIEQIVDDFGQEQKRSRTLKNYNEIHHQFLNIRFNKWISASFADLYAMLTHGILGKVAMFIDPKDGGGLQNGLIQAIPNLVSNEPIFRNWDIIELIKSHRLESWFKETDETELWENLKAGDHPVLYARVQEYLDDFGYRCSGELTLFMDNYIERPESFITMLKLYLRTSDKNPRILFQRKHKEQTELLKKTQRRLSNKTKNPFKKVLYSFGLKFLVKQTCFAISCRERVRLKQALLYHHFKQNIINTAIYFGFEKEDFYFLEYDEISRLLAGEKIDLNYYKELIKLRRKNLESAKQAPDDFYTHQSDSSYTIYNQENVDHSDGSLQGLPACSGVIEGPVKVLSSVHEIHKLEKGDILVTQQTDPGWIYAFPLISGLIVERGGMLSHGAIVAREFGIPAVVGVANITKILKDGQVVTLDGNKGLIKC